jgi:hypothetical protein
VFNLFIRKKREKNFIQKTFNPEEKKTLIRPGLDTNPMLKNLSDVMNTSEK